MTLEEEIGHRVEDDVAWITLNRPDVGNAVAAQHRDRIIELVSGASASTDIRAVVITGTGRSFCTGVDLRTTPYGASADAPAPTERVVLQATRTLMNGAQRLVTSLLDCDKPVVAAVNGTAAGIGVHLALAADLVLAASSARLIEVFVRRGIAPDGAGIYLLPRLVGLQKAKELMFFGDDVSAEEAARIGLVNRVVPDGELEDTARQWAQRLAAGPTVALALTKRLLNRSLDSDRPAALTEEAFAQELVSFTHDSKEGVTAFMERRPPQFRGR